MNQRQQHLETLLFGNPDRIPFSPGGGRESTRANWYKQGLPRDVPITLEAYRQAGGKLEFPKGGPGLPLNQRMIPEFEEKVIETKENSQVVQDWKGNICEIGLEFDVTYLRNASDFVTRRWIKCPIESRKDWKEMMKRYDADDVNRIPEDQIQTDRIGDDREHFITFNFHGPYWQLREWFGFEGLSMMFYDDPVLVMDMIKYWEDFVMKLLKRAFKFCKPDMVHFSEDMAYKCFSMLSPEMCREFLLPTWKKWGEVIRDAGVPLYAIDSDGFIGELIPIWIEAGVNCCDPIEVAAGNDICEFRKQFGKNMAYRGGVDKREMAKGGVHIEREMERLSPVIKDGGYIPSCDHGVPSDVSWPNFVYYCKLLAEQTGWM
jgi:hypothetical protein